MVFYTLVAQFYLKNAKKIPFWRNNPEEKQNRATKMISVDEKATVFPMKLKLQGKLLE